LIDTAALGHYGEIETQSSSSSRSAGTKAQARVREAAIDRIRLNDMEFFANHGVLPEERALGQRFVVSVELRADLRRAGASDELGDTVNYAAVFQIVREVVTGPACSLIETVAERISRRILVEHPRVESVEVRVRKPSVPIAGAVLGSSEVCIERTRQDEREEP